MKKGKEEEEFPSSSPLLLLDKESRLSHFSQLPVNEFIPGISPEISLFSTVTIYGKRKSGKSVFIKWFLQAYRHLFPWAWVFTLTKMNSWYESFMPEKFVLMDFSPEVMRLIMTRQKEAVERSLDQQKHGFPPDNPRAVVMWDDYPTESDIRYNEALREYYYTGRHYATMNIFATQYIKTTTPAIRANTDIVILFNSDYADSVEDYWRDFAGKIPKEVFYQIYEQYTREPYHFLAIVNDPNLPVEEKFFHGCAEDLPAKLDFILGCPDYWKGSEKQLKDIESGEFQKKHERIKKMAEYATPKKKEKSKPKGVLFDEGQRKAAVAKLRDHEGIILK